MREEQEWEERWLQEQQEEEEREFEEAIRVERVRLEEERRWELEEIQRRKEEKEQEERHWEWEKKLVEAAKIVPMDEDDEELEAGPSNPKKRKLGEMVS